MSIAEEVCRTLQKTGEQFRDLALDRCAAMCDELFAAGLGADDCAAAIRQLKEAIHERGGGNGELATEHNDEH